jgi:hypothetical protein
VEVEYFDKIRLTFAGTERGFINGNIIKGQIIYNQLFLCLYSQLFTFFLFLPFNANIGFISDRHFPKLTVYNRNHSFLLYGRSLDYKTFFRIYAGYFFP